MSIEHKIFVYKSDNNELIAILDGTQENSTEVLTHWGKQFEITKKRKTFRNHYEHLQQWLFIDQSKSRCEVRKVRRENQALYSEEYVTVEKFYCKYFIIEKEN